MPEHVWSDQTRSHLRQNNKNKSESHKIIRKSTAQCASNETIDLNIVLSWYEMQSAETISLNWCLWSKRLSMIRVGDFSSEFYMRITLKVLEINLKAYTRQVLENTVVSFLQDLKEDINDTVFMKNEARVHLEWAKLMRAKYKIKEFTKSWPLSSSDLNSIKKIWHWMKMRIMKMKSFSITIETLKTVMQALWNEMNSCMFISHIKKMSEKLWEMIKQWDYATKY